MNQNRFYYQPSPIFSTIDWCWTFIVLLTGIIFWLEVTHFQWITSLFFIAFFVIAGLELLNRQLVINNGFLVVKDMFGRNWHQFDIRNDVDKMTFNKHSIVITKHGHRYQFSITNKSVQQLKAQIKAALK